MMTTTVPLLPLPIGDNSKLSGEFTRRHGVLLISVLEMFGCLAGAMLYIYTLAYEPPWGSDLVPIPPSLCSSQNIVHGVMYVFVLLFVMEFFQAVCLFDGARRESIGRVRFWLYSMLTYLILLSVVVIGMELGGVRSPTMNSVAFINIFIRFLEIMIVYAWAEQEAMNMLRLNVSRSRNNGLSGRCLAGAVSTNTINTVVDLNNGEGDDDDEPPTPPPSYDSTLPPMLSQTSQQWSIISSPPREVDPSHQQHQHHP